MVAYIREYIKNYWIVYFKGVNYISKKLSKKTHIPQCPLSHSEDWFPQNLQGPPQPAQLPLPASPSACGLAHSIPDSSLLGHPARTCLGTQLCCGWCNLSPIRLASSFKSLLKSFLTEAFPNTILIAMCITATAPCIAHILSTALFFSPMVLSLSAITFIYFLSLLLIYASPLHESVSFSMPRETFEEWVSWLLTLFWFTQ